ncbi:hypothetical protein D3H65_19680 [Paraflavitalea soli]|uniref:DUF4251 domain-containing protein n=1 Tax=Paraflavitalea soli TaxID=2315862 RepID=A0A3B7MPI4_9BACT|nr:hypothetical protein [Paraflavitalea soli]AXY76068.1 hypothetical protein D3H65_19680 [Paraflavitalea soli]
MKQLLTFLLLLSSLISKSQNVGIGIPNPLYKLDVWSPESFVARFNGAANMYLAIYETNVYRGYIGSFAGSPEDVDFGTGFGNATGKVHLTIQGTPMLTVNSTGSIDITNELTRTSKTGTANLLPIAYGNVSSTGFANTGSGNFTVSHTSTGFYEITITGENYQFQQYITVVTPIGTIAPIIAATGSGAGKLQVSTYNITGADTDSNFHFVVYKP